MSMVEYGIWTTKAKWILHLYPLRNEIYVLRTKLVREYIKERGLKEIVGKSRDGTISSGGYLIPKTCSFVRLIKIPSHYCEKHKWRNLTPRQYGWEIGEPIIRKILNDAVFWTACELWKPVEHEERIENRCNFVGIYRKSGNKIYVWSQTCLKDTGNLFIQKKEGGHKVHLTPSGEKRFTKKPKQHTWKSEGRNA